jgi:hypothetical protein
MKLSGFLVVSVQYFTHQEPQRNCYLLPGQFESLYQLLLLDPVLGACRKCDDYLMIFVFPSSVISTHSQEHHVE